MAIGVVMKRPSSVIRSPYVADVCINGSTTVLAHSVSLGCCGLVEAGASVAMVMTKTTSDKCSHRIVLSIVTDARRDAGVVVGVHPKVAEDLVEACLQRGLISCLGPVREYKREQTVAVGTGVEYRSRFDFTGVDAAGKTFVMEVKNVPLADFEDVSRADRRRLEKADPNLYTDREMGSKVAYFPDGYRKKATSGITVSPRALKHIRALTLIKNMSRGATHGADVGVSFDRCIMCYVIQRTDVDRFAASRIDPQYRHAFAEALAAGVEVVPLVVHWRLEGCTGVAEFVRDDLPLDVSCRAAS